MELLHRATTHTDLQLRASALGITVKIIHNASIMNAVGACGLQLYRFGEVNLDAFPFEAMNDTGQPFKTSEVVGEDHYFCKELLSPQHQECLLYTLQSPDEE